MSRQTTKKMSATTKQELLEMGLDIACFGDKLDRIGTDDKAKLFKNMRAAYRVLGERFQHVAINVDDGEVMWDECAPWYIEHQDQGHCMVGLRWWACAAKEDVKLKLTPDAFMGDMGPWTIHMPFSVKQATMVSASTKEMYSMTGLSAAARRKLVKRPSDESGATSIFKKTHFEHVQQARAAKAKAAPIGVQTFAKPPSDNTEAKRAKSEPGVVTDAGGSATGQPANQQIRRMMKKTRLEEPGENKHDHEDVEDDEEDPPPKPDEAED